MHRRTPRFKPGWVPVLGALLLSWLSLGSQDARAQAEIKVHFRNGTIMDAMLSGISDQAISVRTTGATSSIDIAYGQIDYVQWPESELWMQATRFYEQEQYEEAIPLFKRLADQNNRTTYYPAPGNYATLGHRRMIDCYRKLGNGTEVARLLKTLETDKLPAGERELPPVLSAWAEAGAENWPKVLEICESATEVSPASGQGIELAYLKGMALKHSGEPGRAAIAFASAYTLNAGTDSLVSRRALAEASAILEQNEDRYPELKAQVHLYATLFGEGSLWEGSSPLAQTALAEPLEVGEAALGQAGRTATPGEMGEETSGLNAVKQVTADHMKEVKPETADPEAGEKIENP